jgi:uncharacterized protein YndB with AHSA1/START domain
MSTDTQTSVRISRVINADPKTLFRAWTEPEQLKRWSCPEGTTLAEVAVDLTVGGRYRLRMEAPDGTVHTAVGVYREIEAPRRLVYTWGWEEEDYDVGETLVTVDFHDRGGASEVVLTHELFPNAEATAQHTEGWTSCFNRLDGMLA